MESYGREDGARSNLPSQLTSFIGRERELADIQRLLATTRILTLVGAGGIGKTRLAIQAAAHLATSAERVWFIDLAAFSDPALVTQAVASAFDVREQPDRPVLDTLIDVLRPRRALLLLDNCEHLVNACALLAARLLRACPGLSLLATSREPLGVSGETVWRVPPLSVPTAADEQNSSSIRREAFPIARGEAVRLFVERAQSALPAFVVSEENAPAVVQICRTLDGIPLAIELAAPLVRGLSPGQIVARLDNRFRLLTGGSRTASPRHQTLLGAIDWSYDLLTHAERVLFRRLSVFAGGWSLEAAESVCSGNGIQNEAVLALLLQLVDKSLVLADDRTVAGAGTSDVRYRLLESLRQYGAQRLREAEEEAGVRERHLVWCLSLAEVSGPNLRGPGGVERITRLEAEHDNLRAALGWSTLLPAEQAIGLVGLRLVSALWDFWWIHGHLSEGRRWLEAALSTTRCGGDGSRPTRAQAIIGAGVLAGAQRDYERAVALCDEGLALLLPSEDPLHASVAWGVRGIAAETRGDYAEATANFQHSLALARHGDIPWAIGWHLGHLGATAAAQGAYAEAAALLEESLDVLGGVADSQRTSARATVSWSRFEGHPAHRGAANWSLQYLGRVATHLGNLPRAVVLFEEGLEAARAAGDTVGAAWALGHLGRVARLQGNHVRAASMLGESLAHFRAAGDRWGVCWTLGNLGRVAHAEHDYQRAEALFEESLVLSTQLAGRTRAVAYALHYLGVVASDQRHPDRAAHLFGAAASLREVAGTNVSPLDRDSEAHELAVVRAALGEAQFAAAWDEGRAMSLEVATDYALARGRPATGAPAESRPLKAGPTYPLSSREHEVAVLLARGLTNRQLAAELVIAERTASTHVAHILNKLGFSSRTQIAAWAIEHDLTGR